MFSAIKLSAIVVHKGMQIQNIDWQHNRTADVLNKIHNLEYRHQIKLIANIYLKLKPAGLVYFKHLWIISSYIFVWRKQYSFLVFCLKWNRRKKKCLTVFTVIIFLLLNSALSSYWLWDTWLKTFLPLHNFCLTVTDFYTLVIDITWKTYKNN